VSELILPRQIAEAMRRGARPTDEAFDRFLPIDLEMASRRYWTPIEVATRVAAWLDELAIDTVMAIGSGAGKFCVAAAIVGKSRFIGVEQRARLVIAARTLAHKFRVEDRVQFIVGDLDVIATIPVSAYYLYNPFGENHFSASGRLDDDVELSPARYERDVTVIETLFRNAPVGTYVITYNGFGGEVPDDFAQIRIAHDMPNVLQMWKKTSSNDLDCADAGPRPPLDAHR
jgi:hypothetical protein